jgi:hypothetical protein
VAVADTLASALVSPDRKPEDPVKARVDRDVASVLGVYQTQNYTSLDEAACDVDLGYVLPSPSSF